MTLRFLALAALCAPLFGGYQYYYSDQLTSINTNEWSQNGTLAATQTGLFTNDTNGGSLISMRAVPDGTSDYEAAATLKLSGTGGTYVLYLRASSEAQSGGTGSGTYFAVEVDNPTCVSPTNCAAVIKVYKRIGGFTTLLSSTPMPIHNGSLVRAVVTRMDNGGAMWISVDGLYVIWFSDSDLGGAGQPGVGGRQMPDGNSISLVQFGLLDRVPPFAVSATNIGTSAFPTCVEMQWQGAADDASGIGIWAYEVVRSIDPNRPDLDVRMVVYPAALEDCTASASTSYTYTIRPIDFHNNYGPATPVTVRTPDPGVINPRRIGVNALGNYWGGSGEQIDTRSGNLNFTLPLLKAQGRGGWAVPFALSYNSQMWRQDQAGTVNLGRDVGFGYGWRFLAGSITPYWSGFFGLHHYVFSDSTGAEYRLDVKDNNNVWTSKQGVYMSYDATNNILYFPDGSFWTMGCTSMGNEGDAGTLYPTQMQDTNGNFIALRYAAGIGSPWSNTSARILELEDVRAVQLYDGNTPTNRWATFQFSYTNELPVPHLSTILPATADIVERHTFEIGAQNLSSPFGPLGFGATSVLTGVASSVVGLHSFLYNGSGEMTKVTLPFGATLAWQYTTNTYINSRSQREVQVRSLQKSPGATATTHTFSWDAGDTGRPVHLYSLLSDNGTSPVSQKQWIFNTSQTGDWWNGVLNHYQESAGGQTPKYQTVYWTEANGTPYIYQTDTTLDYNTVNAVTTRTTQTLDTHGNLVSSSIYDYAAGNSPGALLRTYTNAYLTSSNYTSKYIFNRLSGSSVSNGSQSINLVSNAYDQYTLTDLTNPAPREHDPAYNTSYIYRGNVTSQTVPGKTVTRYFDIAGNVKSASDANLNVAAATGGATNYAAPSSVTANNSSDTTIGYTFNGALDLTGVSMPNNARAGASYYSQGQPSTVQSAYGATTTYAYSYSNTVPSTVTATTNGHWTRSTMDGVGRTVKVETGDVSGTKSVTESVYAPCACSPMGKVWKVSQPHALNAPDNSILWTQYTYDARGRTLTITKPDNSITTYLYAGNTTKVTDAAGNWKIFTTDALGHLTQVQEQVPQSGSNLARGKSATQSSTAFNTAAVAVDGNTNGNWSGGSVTHTGFDTNAWWQVDLGSSAAINSIAIWNRTDCCQDRMNNYWVFVSDTPFGPGDTPATLANRAGTWSSHQSGYPNPSIHIALSAQGRYVRVQLSGANYLSLAEVQVFGQAGSSGPVITTYTYNLLNKLTTVAMPRDGGSQTRTFNYDATTGLLASATNPENGKVSYTYNGDGTLATRTDANEHLVQYSYDNYQRLTKVQRSDGTEDNYTYDRYSTSGFASANALGRLAAVTFQGQQVNGSYEGQPSGTASFTYMYSYTPAGLMTAKRLRTQLIFQSILTPPDVEADYVYDDEGRMTSLTYPLSGPTFTYGYDGMGRLNTLSQTAGTSGLGSGQRSVVTGTTYGPAGELLSMSGYGSETRRYNSLLQLTSISTSDQFNQLVSMQYTYPDGANIGKITTQKNMLNGEEVEYQYDALGRMISAQTTGASQGAAWGYSYTYDGFGNLQAKNVTQGSPSAGWSGGVSGDTNRAFGATYDYNGNTLSTMGTWATYDVENRMISYMYGGTERYGYDPSNKRVQKTRTDGVTEIHFYGARGERLGIYELNIDVGHWATYGSQKLNLYFAGKHFATFDSSSFSRRGVDRLGSETSNLYPWGEERTTTGQNTEKFATYYRDGTGLDYADQRYYSSIMGRFLTADLYTASGGLGNPQSWNRYSYALGDPINLYDPHGTQACPPDDPCPPPSPPPGWTPVQFPGQGGPNRPWQTQVPIDPPQLNDKQILSKAEQLAKKWLRNPDCAKLFGTGFDPVQVLSSLMTTGSFTSGNTQIRLFSFTFGTSALGGLTLPAASVSLFPPRIGLGADIFINTGVFSSVYPGDPSGAALETAETLIEELGHAYNYASGSGGSSIVYDNPLFAPSYQVGDNKVDAGTYNYTQIMKNCNK